MKTISIIAAVSQNGIYAAQNKIPWHSAEDFKKFKSITSGGTVIMGRITWETLPLKNRPLPGRQNIVISSTMVATEGMTVCKTLEEAISQAPNQNIFILGGERLWHEALQKDLVDYLYITVVRVNVPEIDIISRTTLPNDDNMSKRNKIVLSGRSYRYDSFANDQPNLIFLYYQKK